MTEMPKIHFLLDRPFYLASMLDILYIHVNSYINTINNNNMQKVNIQNITIVYIIVDY